MMMMVIVMKKYVHTAIQSDNNVGLETSREKRKKKLESFLRQLNKPMEIVLAGGWWYCPQLAKNKWHGNCLSGLLIGPHLQIRRRSRRGRHDGQKERQRQEVQYWRRRHHPEYVIPWTFLGFVVTGHSGRQEQEEYNNSIIVSALLEIYTMPPLPPC